MEPALGLYASHAYAAHECSLSKGDSAFFFTDGLYEVEGADLSLFGRKRLVTALEKRLSEPPEVMLDGILTDIGSYARRDDFADDVCMVTMAVRTGASL